jgi:hypothetical protein
MGFLLRGHSCEVVKYQLRMYSRAVTIADPIEDSEAVDIVSFIVLTKLKAAVG